jgi:predicted TIM-barrel fold metal-dependent hydrolase
MGFIFECQAYPYQIEKLLPMIEDLKLPTMIEHLALPAWHDHKQKWLWQSIVNKIEQNPYVYIKLSAIDMFQPRENFSFILDQVFEKISNRCVYGSNYPVSFTQNYNYWFDYLNQYPFTQNERRQIFYGNAQKFYKMHN